MTEKLKLGEIKYFSHLDHLCFGLEGRCYLCGGLYGECDCGDCNYDACICGGKIENIWQVKPIHIIKLFWYGFIRAIYNGLEYNDWFDLTDRWRGK